MCVGTYACLCSKVSDDKHDAVKILSQCMLLCDARSASPGGLQQMSISSSEELLWVGGCNSFLKLGAELGLNSSLMCYPMGRVPSGRHSTALLWEKGFYLWRSNTRLTSPFLWICTQGAQSWGVSDKLYHCSGKHLITNKDSSFELCVCRLYLIGRAS